MTLRCWTTSCNVSNPIETNKQSPLAAPSRIGRENNDNKILYLSKLLFSPSIPDLLRGLGPIDYLPVTNGRFYRKPYSDGAGVNVACDLSIGAGFRGRLQLP